MSPLDFGFPFGNSPSMIPSDYSLVKLMESCLLPRVRRVTYDADLMNVFYPLGHGHCLMIITQFGPVRLSQRLYRKRSFFSSWVANLEDIS